MVRASDELLDVINATERLLAQAEQELEAARSETAETHKSEVKFLLQDLHALHRQILSLDADINRAAIDQSALTNHNPKKWIRR